MTKKILQIVFFISTILASLSGSAQEYPDYVITVKGDSIPCKARFPLNGTAKYKSDTMRKFKKINADEITEFYIAEETALYRAVYINNSKTPDFLLTIEKGKISLYQKMDTKYSPYGPTTGTASYATTGTAWYVGKGSDHVRDFKFNGISVGNTRDQRKADFAKLLIDNKDVYDKFIADDDFSFHGIQNIAHIYNTGEAYDGTSNGTEHVSDRSYIVTPKNDTIFCSIRDDYFTRKYMFRSGKNDDFTTIDTANTREFFLARNTSHFVPVHVPGLPDKVFLKQLEKGKVNLYQQTVVSNERDRKEPKSFWYINKQNGPLILIANRVTRARKFQIKYDQLKVFYDVIADNPGLLSSCKKAFNKSEMNDDEVIRYFIQNYNFLYLANNK